MANTMNHSFTMQEEKSLFSTLRKFSALEDQRDLYWMMLIRYTARRVQTVHLLDDVDALSALDKGYLHIESAKQKGGKADSARGLNKAQELYLVDKAKTALLGLLKIRRAMLKRLGDNAKDTNALILSRRGKRMSVRSMQHRMTYWCQKAGIPNGSPHWLRHTWAVRRLQNASGSNDKALREIQDILGHQYITTTQIYTQPNREDLKQSMLEAAL